MMSLEVEPQVLRVLVFALQEIQPHHEQYATLDR
jgi:hypothetical protein